MSLSYVLFAMSWFAGGLGLYFLAGYLFSRPMVNARKGGTLQSFQQEFSGSVYSAEAIEMAYADIVEVQGHHVLRKDKLANTLGMGDLEFESMLERRLQKLGLNPDIERTEFACLLPVWTVEDYVALIAAVRPSPGPEHAETKGAP